MHHFISFHINSALYPWVRLRPLAYVFSFPKWCRDEFISRSTWENSYLRRWILRAVPVLQKPEFDASLCFKKNEVAYDWGSEARWVNVCMNTKLGHTEVVKLGFWCVLEK